LYFFGFAEYSSSAMNVLECMNLFIFCWTLTLRVFAFQELNRISEELLTSDTFTDISNFADYSYFSCNLLAVNGVFTFFRSFKVSERSERALMKSRVVKSRVVNLAKWLQ